MRNWESPQFIAQAETSKTAHRRVFPGDLSCVYPSTAAAAVDREEFARRWSGPSLAGMTVGRASRIWDTRGEKRWKGTVEKGGSRKFTENEVGEGSHSRRPQSRPPFPRTRRAMVRLLLAICARTFAFLFLG